MRFAQPGNLLQRSAGDEPGRQVDGPRVAQPMDARQRAPRPEVDRNPQRRREAGPPGAADRPPGLQDVSDRTKVTPLAAPAGTRKPPTQKARELAAALRRERPDLAYLKSVFRALRVELDVQIPRAPKRLPYVPSEDEIRRYYHTVWQARNAGDIVLIKTLLYTGVRVSELVTIRLSEVDFERCQIRVTAGKGQKDRIVPFPGSFKEVLALHASHLERSGATYLFETSWKKR